MIDSKVDFIHLAEGKAAISSTRRDDLSELIKSNSDIS